MDIKFFHSFRLFYKHVDLDRANAKGTYNSELRRVLHFISTVNGIISQHDNRTDFSNHLRVSEEQCSVASRTLSHVRLNVQRHADELNSDDDTHALPDAAARDGLALVV